LHLQKGMAQDALILAPDNKTSHNALRDAENGVIFDWNFSNRHKLIEYYKNFVASHPDEWLACSSRGDCMVKFCRYDEAIEYYSKGYELQPNPKYTDSLIAISHIYEIQGKYDKAIEKFHDIIALLESDWKVTEGEGVDFYNREIED
jgi:tetratricopeptide (TPR) repeat protein